MLRATPDVVLRGMAGILALFALFGFNSQALAASQTWTGLTDAYWADANWLTAVPGTGDTAIFNGIGNANTTLNLGSGVTIASTIFSTPSAAAYTIGSGSANNQTLTLNDAGSITMNAGVANNELFNAGIILGTDATALTYNFVNNSLTNTLTFAGNITGGAGGTAGIETLDIGGMGNTLFSGNLYKSATSGNNINLTKIGSGTFTVDSTSNIGSASGTVAVNDGTLAINFTNAGSNASLLSSFSPLALGGGTLQIIGNGSSTSTQTFAGVTSNPGYNVITLGTNAPALAMGTFTQNLGSQTVFYGPAYYNGVTTSGVTTPTANVTATGSITTTTTGNNTNLLWGAARIAVSTVGLYNWASVSTTAGTNNVKSGDQVTGFYTQLLNNANITNADANYDLLGNANAANVGGSGSYKTDSYLDTIRFNVAGAYTFKTSAGGTNGDSEVGGILVTPNVGANNTTIASGGAYLSPAAPQSGTVSAMDVYQNNTAGELLFTVPFQNAWNGSNFNDAGSYVQGGPGTVSLTGESTSDVQTGSTYLNGGTTIINDNSQLGKVSSNAALNLNGGTVLGSASSLSLSTRAVALGGSGGGLAAVNGDTMTVGGVISGAAGTGPLIIGLPTAGGLVPGTGSGTPNAAVYATGTVSLTGANTYTGGTELDSGILSFTALTQIGGTTNGGIILNGGTLQYGTGNTADISASGPVTILSPGGTIDVNDKAVTYANSIGNYGTGSLTVASSTAGGSLTLNGNSTFTGGLTDGAGATVNINAPTAITGAVVVNDALNLGSSATLSSPASLTLVGASALDLNGQTISTGPFSGTTAGATVASAGSGGSLTVNQGGATNTFAGVISGSSFNFATAGTGTTILSGVNTYTGTTSVGGTSTLQVNGGTGNLGTGAITVGNGATLNAQGTVSLNGSSLTVNAGGGFSTVDGSVNTITLGGSTGLTLNGTTTTPDILSFDLSSTGSGASVSATGDLLSVPSGSITFAGSNPDTAIFGTGLVSGSALTSGTAAEVLYVPGATLVAGDFTIGGTGIITLGTGFNASSYTESVGVGSGADSGVADALYIDLSLHQTRFYWTGNGGTDAGSWSDTTNFATDHTGATPDTTTSISAASNIFLTADAGATNGNYIETLDGDYTINSLSFAGTGSGAASYSVNLAPGSAGSANYLIIDGVTSYGNPNSGVSYAAGTGLAVEAGSASHTISANVELGNSQVWAINNSSANPLVVSGTISNFSAAAGITKTGPGTLLLSASNTYSGGTTVYGGLLQLGAANALLPAGALTVSGTGASAGTVDLAGYNQTVGTLSDGGVSVGTITDSTGSATLTVNNSSPNTYGGTITDTVATTGGVLGVKVSGGSSLTLSAANSYNGPTTVTSGTLIAGNNAAIGNVNSSTGGLILNPSGSNTATADFISSLPSIASLTGTGNVVLGNTSGVGSATTLTVGGAAGLSGTLTGVISDGVATKSTAVGNLVVNGGSLTLVNANTYSGSTTVSAGSLVLNNSNSFTGLTNVSGGNLTLGNANAIASSSALNLTGGTVGFSTLTGVNLNGLEGTANLQLNNASSAGVALTLGASSGSWTYTGNLYGAGSLVVANGETEQIGSGTTGGASYTGATTVDVGTLIIGGTSSLTGQVYMNGVANGANAVGAANNLTIQDNATVNSPGTTYLSGNNGGSAYPGASVLTVTGTGKFITAGLSIGNTSRVTTGNTITVAQLGTLTDNGPLNLYVSEGSTGGTSIVNLNGGTLGTQNIIRSGGSSGTTTSTIYLNGGTLEALANDGANSSTYFLPTMANTTAYVSAGGAVVNTNGYTITFQQALVNNTGSTGGGLTKTGAGILYLADANTYTGVTNINAGTLSLDNANALGGGGNITFGGGTLQYTSANNTTDYSARMVNSTTAPISLDDQGYNLTFSHALASSNTGGLTLGNSSANTGSLTLATTQSYTGPTTVNQGTLKLSSGASLANTVVTVNSGATFDVLGNDTIGTTTGGLTLNGGSTFAIQDSAAGTVTINSTGSGTGNILTVGGASSAASLDFEINSTGSDVLVVNNGETAFGGDGGKIFITDLTPSAAPLSSYTLISDAGGGLANGLGNGAYFHLGTTALAIDGTTYILSLSSPGNTSEVLTLTAATPQSLYWAGGGTTAGSWTDTSNFTTDSAGMSPDVDGALTPVTNIFETAGTAVNLSQTLGTAVSINSLAFNNASGITIAPGSGGSANTLTIAATGAFTDGVSSNSYNPGTGLVVEAGAGANTISANVLLGNSQTWELDNSPSAPLTVSGQISDGSALDALTLVGSGELILTATNAYDGGTNVDGSTLKLGITNALLPTGALVVSGSGTLDLAGYSQTVASLNDGSLSTGTITASTGSSTLTVNNAVAYGTDTYSGLIEGPVGISHTGNGVLVLSDSNSNTGPTSVTAGTLVAANNYALGSSTSSSGGLTIGASGTVDFTSASPNIASLTASAAGAGVVLGNSASGGSATILNVGGNSATTVFAGVISDKPSSTAAAVGSLNITGGQLTLTGANTFSGTTSVSGGTLVIGNQLALQDSTVNYNNQGGTLSFGSLATATFGALSGSENLALTSTAGAVALNIGGSGLSSVYTGDLGGSGSSLTMNGATNTIQIGSGANGGATYTGATTVNGGNLIIGGTSSLTGAVSVTGANNAANDSLTVQDTATINSTAPLYLVTTNGNGYPGSASMTIENSASVTVAGFSFGNTSGRVGIGSYLTIQNSASLIDNGLFDFINTDGGTTNQAGVTVNLNGGTLAAQNLYLLNPGGNGASYATFNLNGGVIKALANDHTYTPAGGSAQVFFPDSTLLTAYVGTGGAIVNPNGYAISFAQPLVHGSGSPDGGLNVDDTTGTGSLTLNVADTFNGNTVVSGGTLIIGTPLAIQDSTLNYNNQGGTFSFGTQTAATIGGLAGAENLALTNASSSAVALTVGANNSSDLYTGILGGSGSLTVAGTGTFTLTAANAYTGATTINSGATLQLGNGTSGNDGTLASTSGVSDNGTLIYKRAGANSAAYAINGSGKVTVQGAGSQTLTAISGYTGATTVASGGTLIVSGTLSGTASVADNGNLEVDGAINPSATVAVAANSILNGTGSVGAITTTGGTLAPGSSSVIPAAAGALTASGNVTLDPTSTFSIRVGVQTETDSDTLNVGGTIILDDATLLATADTSANDSSLMDVGDLYVIINGGAGATGTGTDVFGNVNTSGPIPTYTNSNGFVFDVLYAVTPTGQTTYNSGGNDVALELVAVPEPGTWASLIGGLGMLVAWQRSRRHRRG